MRTEQSEEYLPVSDGSASSEGWPPPQHHHHQVPPGLGGAGVLHPDPLAKQPPTSLAWSGAAWLGELLHCSKIKKNLIFNSTILSPAKSYLYYR